MTHHPERHHPNLCGYEWDDHWCLLGGDLHYESHLCECGQRAHQTHWDKDQVMARMQESFARSEESKRAFDALHPPFGYKSVTFAEYPDGVMLETPEGQGSESLLHLDDINNLIAYLQTQKARLQ